MSSSLLSSPKARERILIVIAGMILVAVVVPLLMSFYGASMTTIQTEHTRRSTELTKLQREEEQGKAAATRLQDLASQTMAATDASRYANWLYQLAGTSQIQNATLSPPSRKSSTKDGFTTLTYTLRGRASLESLASFLSAFRRVSHLHLISAITITPVRESREMTIVLTIETVVFPQTKSTGSLAMPDKDFVRSADQERAMLKAITDRSLFSAWRAVATTSPQPPRNAPPPRPAEFDNSPFTYLTATTDADGYREAWIDYRTLGKKERVRIGDSFSIEGTRCVVKDIRFDRLVIEALGELYAIRIGKSFADFEDVVDDVSGTGEPQPELEPEPQPESREPLEPSESHSEPSL